MLSEFDKLKTDVKWLKSQIKSMTRSGPNTNRARIAAFQEVLIPKETALRGLELRKRVADAGLVFDEWWSWAMSLYLITQQEDKTYTVDSHARDWDKNWNVPDYVSAEEKIEQLCGYKVQDRKRGRGDMDKDLSKTAS